MKDITINIRNIYKLIILLFLITISNLSLTNLYSAQVVSAGENHSVAIDADGKLLAWGKNEFGQLGNGNKTNLSIPVQIEGNGGNNWITVSAGSDFTIAILSEGSTTQGSLWAWGHNNIGQLGKNDLVDSNVPVKIGTDTNWVSVSAGSNHVVAIKSDNTVWAWGSNSAGQTGVDSSFAAKTTPQQVMLNGAAFNATAVSAGYFYTLAIRSDNTLWAWGTNFEGSLGVGSATANSFVPVQIGSASNWQFVSAGNGHSFAINSSGELWAWGRSSEGQLGIGSVSSNQFFPVQVPTEGENWQNVSAGVRHTIGLKTDGTIWAWGKNSSGQLSLGDTINRFFPVQISATGQQFLSVSAGLDHSLVFETVSGESVFGAGDNTFGQLGNGTNNNFNTLSLSVLNIIDLIVTNLATTTILDKVSEAFSVQFTISNTGSKIVPANSSVRFELRLSLDTTFDAADILLDLDPATVATIDPLIINEQISANAVLNKTVQVKIPDTITANQYFLLGKIDVSGVVAEFNENNNTAQITDSFKIFPDLLITGLTVDFGATATLPTPNNPFAVEFNINNAGVLDVGANSAVRLDLRLSFDNEFSDNDISLDLDTSTSAVIDPLTINRAVSAKTTEIFTPLTVLPPTINPGTYNIVAKVNNDNNLSEFFTGNNDTATTSTFTLLPEISGRIFNIQTANNTILPTEKFSFSVELTNNGLAQIAANASGSFFIKIILTPDEIFGNSNDLVIIESFPVTNLIIAGDTIELSLTDIEIPISTPLNTYFIGMQIDSTTVVSESNEDNNNFITTGNDKIIVTGIELKDALDIPSVTVNSVTNKTWFGQRNVFFEGDWKLLAAGNEHSIAIREDGTLWGWGNNTSGQVGISSTAATINNPSKIGRGHWQAIASGANHALGIQSDSTLWAWGANVSGQLGNNTTTNSSVPVKVSVNNLLWSKVAAGDNHSLALTNFSDLYVWGDNTNGQNGNGSTGGQVNVPALINISSRDLNTAAFINGSGSLTGFTGNTTSWSGNHTQGTINTVDQQGTFAIKTGQRVIVKFNIPTSLPSSFIVAGASVADSDANPLNVTLNSIGRKVNFGIGEGVSIDEPGDYEILFVATKDVADCRITFHVSSTSSASLSVNNFKAYFAWKSIAAGGNHALAISDTGNLWAWGLNTVGQLGDGSNTLRNFPVMIGNDVDWVTVSAGANHSLALKTGNTLHTWGANDMNQLGDGTTTNSNVPKTITVTDQGNTILFSHLDAGADHATAISTSGTIWAWGLNDSGQLGDNTTINKNIPVKISTETDWVTSSSGGNFTIGIRDLAEVNQIGRLLSWGKNTTGQLGLGTTVDSLLPTTTANDSAVQSPSLLNGEEAAFEIEVAGPVFISYFWKVSSQNQENCLKFTIDGAQPASNGQICGSIDWQKVEHILPADLNKLRWTYSQGVAPVAGIEDVGYIDLIEIEQIVIPDFIIESVDFTGGILVPEQNSLDVTVLGRNQGKSVELPDNFKVKLILSLDRNFGNDDDILIGDLDRISELDLNDRFVYKTTRQIPKTTPAGDYYVIVVVDPEEITTDSINGLVVEFDENNNIFVAPDNNITIQPRPDLTPLTITHNPYFPESDIDKEKNFFLHGETFEATFDFENRGLADIPSQPFSISLVVSRNRVFNTETDYVLATVTDSSGLPVGRNRKFREFIELQPDSTIGELLYLGVIIDGNNNIIESDETNNTLGNVVIDQFVFSEMSIVDAVDGIAGRVVTNGTFDDLGNRLDLPFFGQSADTFDGVDAARSINIRDAETASFQFTVDNTIDSVVSFAWKVSSFGQTADGIVLFGDGLSFFIDGEVKASIAGTDEEDELWRVRSFAVPAGQHVLRWAYIKNDEHTAGMDTGWVDNIQIDNPDLQLINLALTDSVPVGGFISGSSTDIGVTLTVLNSGRANILNTSPFTIQIRLSPDLEFDENNSTNRNDFIVNTFQVTDNIPINGSMVYTKNIDIPRSIAIEQNYYLAARVDFLNDIPESKEGNNDGFTSSDIIAVKPSIDLDTALDFTSSFGWKTGGAGTFFGQNNTFATSAGNSSAVQVSSIVAGQESFLETQIVGPKILTFQWKVSSIENFNNLIFKVSDVEVTRISGDVGFSQFQTFIPAGNQTIKWVYSKSSNLVENGILDTGFVDLVNSQVIVKPDLLIQSLVDTAGEYIVDQQDTIDGGRIPVTVIGLNRGADIPSSASVSFENVDIQVRLSGDLIWGNQDDIILGGSLSLVSSLDSGRLLQFGGFLTIPKDTPVGSYYLASYIDFLDNVDEFSFDSVVPFSSNDNNLKFSETRSISILRLPDLEAEILNIDTTKIYYPETPLRIRYNISNRGLGDVPGNVKFNQRIVLHGILPADFTGTAEEILNASTEIKDLVAFDQQAFLPGSSLLNPGGSALTFDSELTLPEALEIFNDMGAEDPISTFIYFLVFRVDTANAIREMDERNTLIFLTSFRIINIRLNYTFGVWQSLYSLPVTTSLTTDSDSDSLSDFQEYALNFNPSLQDSIGVPSSFGMSRINGEDFLRMSFDMLKRSSDIIYMVEISNDGVNWNSILDIRPPFTAVDGSQSLTGIGGLLSQSLVIGVSDQNYSARITVRDNVPVNSAQTRLMRLSVDRISN